MVGVWGAGEGGRGGAGRGGGVIVVSVKKVARRRVQLYYNSCIDVIRCCLVQTGSKVIAHINDEHDIIQITHQYMSSKIIHTVWFIFTNLASHSVSQKESVCVWVSSSLRRD